MTADPQDSLAKPPNPAGAWPGSKLTRLLLVVAGIALGQAILYGPSLIGRQILLPLDLLAEPLVYLPRTPDVAKIVPQNIYLCDLVQQWEPARRFAVSELHAGRLPVWAPYYYAGVPFIWPKFSPFLALECLTASPVVLAWGQLFAAVVAGFGMYLFCRRVPGVGFWPATIVSWCYPLTGFFIFWQGIPTCLAVYWLPWVFLAVDATARNKHPAAPAGLSLATCLALISGTLDVAGQVLLGSGLFALWCIYDANPRRWLQPQAGKAVLKLAVGWALGFLLAAPYVLPVLDYTHAGARMARRSAGYEERPPVGLKALPQVVLPDVYGPDQTAGVRFAPDVQIESSATAYSGVIATLLVAPLAWCSRRHRSINLFWAFLCLFSLSWCVNVPGFVTLLRLPGLNMMSHSRLVFLASFAILAMVAGGLEVLGRETLHWRRWFWVPAGTLGALCAWCLYRATFLPEKISSAMGVLTLQGGYDWVHNVEWADRAQSWLIRHYAVSALLCAVGWAGWLWLWRRAAWQARAVPVLGMVLLADLLWFAHGRNPQCDPALYFPRLPALGYIAQSSAGRIVGANCLPPSVAEPAGLQDVRGYDAVDPAHLVELVALAAGPQSRVFPWALIQWLAPKMEFGSGGGVHLPPVLDMLDVRYLVGRGSPPAKARPAFQSTDYWVMVNSNALPRPFVPHRVETISEAKARLAVLGAPDFDPHEVAYVESPVHLPEMCRGVAEITREVPTRISMSLRMETPGLVVLADRWDKGWKAYLNGKPAPILRTNHAVRGVLVPAGSGTLEFVYAPASLSWGFRLAGLAALILVVWVGAAAWAKARSNYSPSI